MDNDNRRQGPVNNPEYSQQTSQQYQSISAAENMAQRVTHQATASSPSFNSIQAAGYPYGYGYTDGTRTIGQNVTQQPNYPQDTPRSVQQYYPQGVQNMVYPPQQYWYGGAVPPPQQRQFRETVSDQLAVTQSYPANSSTMTVNAQQTSPRQPQYYIPEQQPPIQNHYDSVSTVNTPPSSATPMQAKPNLSHSPPGSLAFTKYNKLLRQTLEYARDERLNDAAQGLRAMSLELLGNVQRLGPSPSPSPGPPTRGLQDGRLGTQQLTEPAGLVFDDLSQRDFRLELWRNFNNTWLTVLQKQKDLCSRAEPSLPPKNRISRSMLQSMGDELVELCNGIDEWGLVDYEMGVWEEQIVDLLDPCLSIAIKLDGPGPGSGPADAFAKAPTSAGGSSASVSVASDRSPVLRRS